MPGTYIQKKKELKKELFPAGGSCSVVESMDYICEAVDSINLLQINRKTECQAPMMNSVTNF